MGCGEKRGRGSRVDGEGVIEEETYRIGVGAGERIRVIKVLLFVGMAVAALSCIVQHSQELLTW